MKKKFMEIRKELLSIIKKKADVFNNDFNIKGATNLFYYAVFPKAIDQPQLVDSPVSTIASAGQSQSAVVVHLATPVVPVTPTFASPSIPAKGLSKPASEIAKDLFNELSKDGKKIKEDSKGEIDKRIREYASNKEDYDKIVSEFFNIITDKINNDDYSNIDLTVSLLLWPNPFDFANPLKDSKPKP